MKMFRPMRPALNFYLSYTTCEFATRGTRKMLTASSQVSNAIKEEQKKAQAVQVSSHNANLDAQTRIHKDVKDGIVDVNTHLSLVRTQIAVRDDRFVRDMTRNHEEIKTLLSSTQLQTDNFTTPTIADSTPGLTLVLKIPQLNLSRRDIASILQHFSGELELVLKLFFASFLSCLKDFLFAVPQMVLLYRVLRRLPQAISLVLHDNITFEDALGRVQSLQFQQFRHWRTFEMSLHCIFEKVPGMQKVLAGEYVLTRSKHSVLVTANNWGDIVRPGDEVKMSILISHIERDEENCPRGCISHKTKLGDMQYSCGECGLHFGLPEQQKLQMLENAGRNEGRALKRRDGEEHLPARLRSRAPSRRPATHSRIAIEEEEMKSFKRISLVENNPSLATRFWVAKEGIEFEVISHEIATYLDNSAFVRLGRNERGVMGYSISATRKPTKAMIQSIREASSLFQLEKAENQVLNDKLAYQDSRTFQERILNDKHFILDLDDAFSTSHFNPSSQELDWPVEIDNDSDSYLADTEFVYSVLDRTKKMSLPPIPRKSSSFSYMRNPPNLSDYERLREKSQRHRSQQLKELRTRIQKSRIHALAEKVMTKPSRETISEKGGTGMPYVETYRSTNRLPWNTSNAPARTNGAERRLGKLQSERKRAHD